MIKFQMSGSKKMTMDYSSQENLHYGRTCILFPYSHMDNIREDLIDPFHCH